MLTDRFDSHGQRHIPALASGKLPGRVARGSAPLRKVACRSGAMRRSKAAGARKPPPACADGRRSAESDPDPSVWSSVARWGEEAKIFHEQQLGPSESFVSVDFNGNTHSSIFDAESTYVINKRLVKVLAWYDNEVGYSVRCLDMMQMIGKKLA